MHGHDGAAESGRLRIAVAGTLGILAVEIAAGLAAHSLALLTDAVHVLTDVAAAILALWAGTIAQRRPDRKRTFGYGRATVLAALVNAIALIVLTVFIMYEAVRRLAAPPAVEPWIMIPAAAFAIAVNVLLALYLSHGGNHSMNVKAVVAHVAGDAAISGAVVLGAIVILLTHLNVVDPILSLIAAAVVVFSVWEIVREAVNVLLEGAPPGMDPDAVKNELERTLGVRQVHDLHIWSVSDGGVAASLHVCVDRPQLERSPDVVRDVKAVLRERFDVTHATVEVECETCEASCADPEMPRTRS
jgi:cobalt-zinc-cadmium efflux system protein